MTLYIKIQTHSDKEREDTAALNVPGREMIANCESMAYYLFSIFSAKPLLVAYSMALFDNGINTFKSTREGRSSLRTLRVERQIVFQLFLREWDSRFP